MNRKLFITVLVAIISIASKAGDNGPRLTPEQYIEQWREVAVEQMQMHGIPASITLAQGLLESGNGNSELARRSNNHFGIKCHGDWGGKRVYHDDDRRGECFRKYKDASDSYQDHSVFLKKQRYEFLFDLKPTDYKGWARGLKKAGYATDPKYPQKLIDLIERYGLHELDRGGYVPKPDQALAIAHNDDLPSDESNTVSFGSGHAQGLHENGIKYLLVNAGDSFESIAKELELRPAMIARWNDMDRSRTLAEGQTIFIQPKRNKARKHKLHHVRSGESLWEISQTYGIKLKKLAEYNSVNESMSLVPGQKILLRKPPRSR